LGHAVQGANGFVHAVAESHNEKIAISVAPLSGRFTAKQIDDAVKDAAASGILETQVLGWAFESNHAKPCLFACEDLRNSSPALSSVI
jgi:hypothetical protein